MARGAWFMACCPPRLTSEVGENLMAEPLPAVLSILMEVFSKRDAFLGHYLGISDAKMRELHPPAGQCLLNRFK